MININDFNVNDNFEFYINGFYSDVNAKPIMTYIYVIVIDMVAGTSYEIQLERAKSSPNKSWAEDEVLKEAWSKYGKLINKPE